MTTIGTGSYSAHADQANLVRFATRMRRPPEVIRLVHGELESREALRLALEQAGGGVVVAAGG
jgi:metallo-beta-lactamase family protein